MARPRTYRCEAVVLKSAPMGEGGLLVTLYSASSGKLRAVVRGARKPSSRMVGHLEPLNRAELSLARSRPGGIDTITQAQVLEGFAPLKASLEGVSRGIYLAELIDGYGVEGSSNPELNSVLLDTLRALNDSPHADLALRYFELHLLKCSGFMPELYRCVECGDPLEPEKHLYSPEAGGTLCTRCTPTGVRIMRLTVQALKVLRYLDRTTLHEISKLHTGAGLDGDLKELLSATVTYWLDNEIRSKRFMEHLERASGPGVYSGA